jgi:hypothetical protein
VTRSYGLFLGSLRGIVALIEIVDRRLVADVPPAPDHTALKSGEKVDREIDSRIYVSLCCPVPNHPDAYAARTELNVFNNKGFLPSTIRKFLSSSRPSQQRQASRFTHVGFARDIAARVFECEASRSCSA